MAVPLVCDEARDPPVRLDGGCRRKAATPALGQWELVHTTVLTPADRLAVDVDEDAVGATLVHELAFVVLVLHTTLGTGPEPRRWKLAPALKVHARAVVPAVAPREQRHEVGPGVRRQLASDPSRMLSRRHRFSIETRPGFGGSTERRLWR